MFWEKKKKDEGLPELPRPSSRPASIKQPFMDDDLDDEEVHNLPAFPDSPMHRGFSQSAIKDAVSNSEDGLPPLKQGKKDDMYKIVEMEEWTPKSDMPSRSRSEPKSLFVRVDKFQLARTSLDNVKIKLTEIEDLLKQIRDVKTKEDAELSSWESEMENIKARVQTVMNNIFEKTDY